jgi:signal transduction histidine kinase
MNATNQLLAGLSAEELRALPEVGAERRFQKGDVIFREGDAGDSMFLIEEGRVAAHKGEIGKRELALATFNAGEFFGEMSMIDGRPRSAHAVAEEPTRLRELRLLELHRLMEQQPKIIQNLLRIISTRLRDVNRRFTEHVVQQEKMSLVGQMASTIIHDFKNPMNIILLSAESIQSAPNDQMRAKFCGYITRNVHRMVHMTSDVLDFARGTCRLNPTWTDPHPWLEELTTFLRPMLDDHHTKLQMDIRTPDKLYMDPDKMGRVIYNLSVNAIEAMEEGGQLTWRVAKNPDGYLLEISDTGPGIPEQIRDRLFDVFVTHGKKNGTGLGTAIAFQIVREHCGSLTFTTETGRGTTFHIRLPLPPDGVSP